MNTIKELQNVEMNLRLIEKIEERLENKTLNNYLLKTNFLEESNKVSVTIFWDSKNEIIGTGKVKKVRDTLGWGFTNLFTVVKVLPSGTSKNHILIQVELGE